MVATTNKLVADFDVIDHGIENSSYFQGCGTAFTPYEHVVTGIGDNPAEAIEDCLENMAQIGFETDGMEARILRSLSIKKLPTKPSVSAKYGDDADECYYHVSIRWNEVSDSDVDEFVSAYVDCALKTSNDESTPSGGNPFDDNYSADDIAADSLASMREDCRSFIQNTWDDISEDVRRAGYDFWLTRNRHGAGFWDGDWSEDSGKRLTDWAHTYGECYLYLGDAEASADGDGETVQRIYVA